MLPAGRAGNVLESRLSGGGNVALHRPMDAAKGVAPGQPGAGGAVAQMGERCNRTAEVKGSIPLGSTSPPAPERRQLVARSSPERRMRMSDTTTDAADPKAASKTPGYGDQGPAGAGAERHPDRAMRARAIQVAK